jgi:hypothetical protein
MMVNKMSDGDIAVVEQQSTPTLIEQTNPVLILEQSTDIANALADIIEKKHLYTIIKGKKHVHVEGWTTLGALNKVFPILDWSKRLDRENEVIYESRIIAKTLKGDIIGVGEALCSNKESNWQYSDEYAIKSMSITRATSKALRIPLGWIMVLAGYEGTPFEEMNGIIDNNSQQSNNSKGKPTKPKRPMKPVSKPKTESQQEDEDLKNLKENAVDAESNYDEEIKMAKDEAITWKTKAKTNPSLKKVCDSVNEHQLEMCEVNIKAEADEMNKNKKLSDKEYDDVMVCLKKIPA